MTTWLGYKNWQHVLALFSLALFSIGLYNFGMAHDGHDHSTDQPDRFWKLVGSPATIQASFVTFKDDCVVLKRQSGTTIRILLDELSVDDQAWVTERTEQIRQLNKSKNQVFLVSFPMPNNYVEAVSPPNPQDSFEPFVQSGAVKFRQDDKYFYVESKSMPDHKMMVGITAWQQQVPLPQSYFGDNAWRIPLHPRVAAKPLSAKSHFFRGAIALAANGVPIFNPIKNDGKTDTLIAGELDEFGGHCGRGDDYHYHIAPTHLQEIVGDGKPVAYALDGYPIYGFNEPDGTKPQGLDSFNGHESHGLGYHYHATKNYPYLNGGFHGEVVERDGQVDPQPDARGIRPALTPLQGAKITGFTIKDASNYSLQYQVRGESGYVNYRIAEDGSVKFEFIDPRGNTRTETYQPRRENRSRGQGGRGNERPNDRPKDQDGRGKGKDNPPPRDDNSSPRGNDRGNAQRGSNKPNSDQYVIDAKKTGKMSLTSSTLSEGKPLPAEFTGDGAGVTPPISWSGAPDGTKGFAVLMDHVDRDGIIKTYWVLHGIPADTTQLPTGVKGIGQSGATWKPGLPYVPPHSAGTGTHVYTLHVYALSENPSFNNKQPVTREQLLKSIKDSILDSSEINVTYVRR